MFMTYQVEGGKLCIQLSPILLKNIHIEVEVQNKLKY